MGRARTLHRLSLAALGVLAALLLAEGAARVLAPALPEPDRWGDAGRAVKAEQMAALAASQGCVDVVVVGDSMARDGLVPSVIQGNDPAGRSVYNAALDASGPELVRAWLADVVNPELHPATIVLALSSIDLNLGSPGVSAATESYATSVGGRSDALGALDRWLSARSALVEHRRELRDPTLLADAIRRRASGEGPPAGATPVVDDLGGGTSRRSLVYAGPGPAAELTRDQLLAGFDLGPDPSGRVAELIGDLAAGGADVVVVVLPTTADFAELHPGGSRDQDAARSAILAGASAAGVVTIDLSDHDLSDDAFADTHHLNGTGADALSADLPALLAASGVAERHCSR